MLNTSEKYKQAIHDLKQHHIKGTIVFSDGRSIDLSLGTTLIGTPAYSRQCTKSSDIFGIGELYTGTAKVTADIPGITRGDLMGGKLSLEFSAGDSEEIHLGTWTVTDPQRDASGTITITAEDCISKLNVPIPYNTVGAIKLEDRLATVTELTGIEFAQTPEEIYALIGGRGLYFGSTFCSTCRDEVTAIAQLSGGFACDDRYGRIVFRRFGSTPVKTIDGDHRHSIRLGEYTFAVRGLSYDSYGHRTIVPVGAESAKPDSAAVVGIPANIYADFDPDDPAVDRYVRGLFAPAARNLNIPLWTPGTVTYYGDPALDLGDMIELTGGINGEGSSMFLITAENWSFRGAHTLISAGAVDGGLSVKSGGTTTEIPASAAPVQNKTEQQIVNMYVTKTLNAVPMKAYAGELDGELRMVAAAGFGAREYTDAFVTVTAIFTGESDMVLNVLLDEVKQTVNGVESAKSGDTVTISLTVDLQASAGVHTVTAEACGIGELVKITASIWGQGITAEQPEFTTSRDYEYVKNDSGSTVTRYIGTSRKPAIPDTLGRAPVRSIAAGAFTGTDVEYVYIPDGVESIK